MTTSPGGAGPEGRDPLAAQQSDAAPGSAIRPCPPCWISIQLLDEDERPVPREPYWIRLPDGQVREGTLNDQGSVRLDPVPCGTCLVRFPRADAPSVHQVGSRADAHRDWIIIRLRDEDGHPLDGQPYVLTLPDGSELNGTLDREGRARHDGIPKGQCKVTFPGLAPDEFLPRSGPR
jgi:hypothetical protein